LQKVFCGVSVLPSLRSTQKCDRGKTDIEVFVDFVVKSFRHGLFGKSFDGIFELPLPKSVNNALKKKMSVGR
jgi:hypothetical protein